MTLERSWYCGHGTADDLPQSRSSVSGLTAFTLQSSDQAKLPSDSLTTLKIATCTRINPGTPNSSNDYNSRGRALMAINLAYQMFFRVYSESFVARYFFQTEFPIS